MTNPYGESAADYWRAGWRGVLPLPLRQKYPPPGGYTGADGAWPSYPDIQTWIDGEPANVALRLPDGVIGLDIDAYAGGDDTYFRARNRLGELPITWRATSRYDGLSGIYLFRVPGGLAWPGEIGPHVEIVQRRHRYMVAPPSIHPSGNQYYWYRGAELATMPRVDDLPEMPSIWVTEYTAGWPESNFSKVQLNYGDASKWLGSLAGETFCRQVTECLARVDLSTESRHEAATRAAMRLVRLGVEGHVGVPGALDVLGALFIEHIGPDRPAAGEWRRIVSGAVAAVAAQRVTPADPCTDFGAGITRPGLSLPAPVAAEPAQGHTEPVAWSAFLVATPASAIAPLPVTWAWQGLIAAGTICLLVGREGHGKSTLAYWVDARLTRGELRGVHFGEPRPVIVGAAEDSWEHVIVPRLMAAGANLDLVYRVEVKPVGGLTLASPLVLPKDIAALTELAHDLKPALMHLDPMISRVDGRLDTHRDSDVRQALEPLAAMADATQLAILGLIHPNKTSTSDPLNAIMGSRAFPAMARTVLSIVTDPDDEDGRRRLFGLAKNNLGPLLPLQGFHIVGQNVDAGAAGVLNIGRVEWGEESEMTLTDAMSANMETARNGKGKKTKAITIQDFVIGYLGEHGGSALGPAIADALDAAGIDASQPTRVRALKALESQGLIVSKPDPQPGAASTLRHALTAKGGHSHTHAHVGGVNT